MAELITIRMGAPKDADTIADFNIKLAHESEAITLNPATVIQGVNTLLKNPQYGFYVVAEQDEQIVGGLMITYEFSDWRNGVIWWVQSVYVRPECRRRGVLKQLFTFIREKAAQQTEARGFRLYVEVNNHNAISGYERVCMNKTDYFMYEDLFSNS